MRSDPGPPKLLLTVLSGPEQGRTLPLHSGSILLGRNPGAGLALPSDATISQSHATLAWEAPRWILRDHGSKNGTFVEAGNERFRVESATAVGAGSFFWLGGARIGITELSLPVPVEQDRLSVGLQAGRLSYQFESAAAIVSRYEQAWEPDGLASILGRLGSLLATAESSGQAPDEATLAGIGRSLSQLLFPQHVVESLFTSGVPLSFLLDPGLLMIPWELLALDDRFLCLERPLARQIIAGPVSARQGAGRQESSHLLIIANPDGSLPDTQREGEALLSYLTDECGVNDVTFLAGSRARKLDVIRQIEEAAIVYYLGHAEHNAETPRQSAWLLADGRLSAEELSRIACPPELVIANACESARETITGTGLPSEGAGLGFSLLLAGVQHYVGALWRVPAVSGAGVGSVLLRALMEDVPIGSALLTARRESRDLHGDSGVTWSAYALYGDPAWRLTPSKLKKLM